MSKTIKFAVSMSAEVYKKLESMRRKEGQTRSRFIRDAVRAYKAEYGWPEAVKEDRGRYEPQPSIDITDLKERRRRAIAAAGRFRSGLTDLSSSHDKYLEDAFVRVSSKKDEDEGR